VPIISGNYVCQHNDGDGDRDGDVTSSPCHSLWSMLLIARTLC